MSLSMSLVGTGSAARAAATAGLFAHADRARHERQRHGKADAPYGSLVVVIACTLPGVLDTSLPTLDELGSLNRTEAAQDRGTS